MLILASILLSRSTNTNGSFSSIPDPLFSSTFPRDTDPTSACPRQRIQIIWACVATILSASWVSVHPNIPNAKESKIKKTLRRIELMIWAILTPELIIYWAMRQWYGARLMEREFEFAELQHTELTPLTLETPHRIKGVKWTRTHGFFLQMGGFMLREEGKKDRVLGWKALMKYYKQGRLNLFDVTEDRINDHSKADGFAKGLALLQMFWFITQCVARFFDKNLILTGIELATAALAVLSLIMYFLWWNKPFNAGVPITITLLPANSTDISLPTPDAINPLNIPHAQPFDSESTHSSDHSVDEAIPLVETNFHLRQSDPANPPASRLVGSAEDSSVAFVPPPNPQSAHPPSRVHLLSGSHQTECPPLPPTIESNKSSDGVEPVCFLVVRLEEMIEVYGETDPIDVPGDSAVTSVPSFYSVQADSPAAYLQMLLTSFSAAALFGSIHCIGWSSKIVFTSHAASLAWRIASVAITASPVVWCLGFVFGYYSEEIFVHGSVLERMFFYFTTLCAFVSAVTIPVYIVARLTLLVLAFVELRHVPPGALDNIPWANVLPFIH